MKLFAVLLLAVYASAGSVVPLSQLTVAPVNPAFTLTAKVPDNTALPVLTAFACATTYDAGAAPVFGACTYTITYTANQNATGFASLYIGTNANYNAIDVTGATTISGSTATTVYTNTGITQHLRFNAAGTYAAVVTVGTTTGRSATASFPAGATGTSLTVTNSYVAPTAVSLQFTGASSAFNGGCSDTNCLVPANFNVTVAPSTNSYFTQANFRATASPQGTVYVSNAVCTAGVCNNGSPFVMTYGGTNPFDGSYTPISALTSSGPTLLPKGTGGAVSVSVVDSTHNFFTTFFSEGTVNQAVTFSSGSTAVAPPTCASILFNPTSATTDGQAVLVTTTLACSAASGSTIMFQGFFLSATVTAPTNVATQTIAYVTPGVATIPFPAYVSGTAQVQGVFAIDNSGNSILYGNCVNAGITSIGCSAASAPGGSGGGGGGSSASTLTLSLFAMLSLLVAALYA